VGRPYKPRCKKRKKALLILNGPCEGWRGGSEAYSPRLSPPFLRKESKEGGGGGRYPICKDEALDEKGGKGKGVAVTGGLERGNTTFTH